MNLNDKWYKRLWLPAVLGSAWMLVAYFAGQHEGGIEWLPVMVALMIALGGSTWFVIGWPGPASNKSETE